MALLMPESGVRIPPPRPNNYIERLQGEIKRKVSISDKMKKWLVLVFLLLFYSNVDAETFNSYCFTNRAYLDIHVWSIDSQTDRHIKKKETVCFYFEDDQEAIDIRRFFQFEAVDYNKKFKIMEGTYINKRWFIFPYIKPGNYILHFEDKMLTITYIP